MHKPAHARQPWNLLESSIMPISEQQKYLNRLWGLKVYTGIAPEGVQKLFEKNPKYKNKKSSHTKIQNAESTKTCSFYHHRMEQLDMRNSTIFMGDTVKRSRYAGELQDLIII